MLSSILSSTRSSLTVNRYLRLMMLSCSEILLTVPLTSFSIYITTAGVTLAPWVSWEETHYNFSRVKHVPSFIWRHNRAYLISVEMSRWIYPFAAFIFFALFGFAPEARRHYAIAYWRILGHFGVKPAPKQAGLELPSCVMYLNLYSNL